MNNYMEKGIIPLRTMCKALRAILVLIPRVRNEVRMTLERVMKMIRCKRILNDTEREINKLMGVGMMMQNMVMV
jgi:hypothetical protein